MRSLYPDIKPFDRQVLEVGDGHQLYVDQSGRPGHHPVVFCTAVRVMAASLIRGGSSIQTSTTLFCLISEVQGARYHQVRFTPIRWII